MIADTEKVAVVGCCLFVLLGAILDKSVRMALITLIFGGTFCLGLVFLLGKLGVQLLRFLGAPL